MSSPERRAQGLIGKFNVSRVDGSDAPGGRHEGCRYFVLDMTHDKHAIPALRAYAESCEADGFLVLGQDLRDAANALEFGPGPAPTKIDRLVDAARDETARGREARRKP